MKNIVFVFLYIFNLKAKFEILRYEIHISVTGHLVHPSFSGLAAPLGESGPIGAKLAGGLLHDYRNLEVSTVGSKTRYLNYFSRYYNFLNLIHFRKF